ncbi:pyridoxamine 5'-phosphate oxidase family protein [uncultured Methanobrevibacter sp.]|uniref:pyridoxamine 5'-phosphate oxidase family protein n=1 Tax=uncultured Methanobrevibacter sp. TaxID=253161 RepID=UPI0025E63ED3|nr:pyridoxamine 5'-phosphate oxidase family protein [uncultured Methanobrevibacter sp.]
MFRQMRRVKQQLSQDECVEILTNEPRGVLALLGDNDYPYAVPMDHVYVDGKIYFHGAQKGHKKDAIENYPKVSYCVIDEGVMEDGNWWYTFKSVIVFGKIRILTDIDEKKEKLTDLGDKFFPTHDYTIEEVNKFLNKTEVFELEIEHMGGKFVREK